MRKFRFNIANLLAVILVLPRQFVYRFDPTTFDAFSEGSVDA
jgi:hypothetical protein